jgi:hypothetical protein
VRRASRLRIIDRGEFIAIYGIKGLGAVEKLHGSAIFHELDMSKYFKFANSQTMRKKILTAIDLV